MKYLFCFLFVLLSFVHGETCSEVYSFIRAEGFANKRDSLDFANLKGLTFSERKETEDAFVHHFENSGFPGAIIRETCKEDTLTISFIRGEGYVFGSPKNALTKKTKVSVFEKLSGIKSGSAFQLENILQAEKKLERTGYFQKRKDTELYREKNRNRLIPLFYMEEIPLSYAEVLVSYASENNEWVGNLDVSLKNIAGTARNLAMSGATGDGTHQISFSYLEPWILNTSWDAIIQGFLKDDSLYKDVRLEAGVRRNISFHFSFTLLGGVGDDEWTTSLTLSYLNKNSFILPKTGSEWNASMLLQKNRGDSSDVILSLKADYERFTPLFKSFVWRTRFSGETLFPTDKKFKAEDLFYIGGVQSFKSLRPDFFKTRAYGFAECALRFTGLPLTAFEIFYQPGLYRAQSPEHGWKEIHQYGLGIIQYRKTFAISVYYAKQKEFSFSEGLLHLGVKVLF